MERKYRPVNQANPLINQLRPEPAGVWLLPEKNRGQRKPSCLKPAWEVLDLRASISQKERVHLKVGQEACRQEARGGLQVEPAAAGTDRDELARSRVMKEDSFSCLGDKEGFPLRLASCAHWKTELGNQ